VTEGGASLSLQVYVEFLRLGWRLEVEPSRVQAVTEEGGMSGFTAVDLGRSEATLAVVRCNLLL
jgi:hypothetical protein